MSISRHNHIAGFTLVEVMIALLIFSIGLLGLVGLQSTAIQDNSRAYYRMQANFLAYDMLDRMRANRAEAITGTYNIPVGPVPSATSCNGSSATCSETAIANWDRREWKQLLAQTLPAGNGSVTQSGSGETSQFVIRVQWDDDKDGVADFITITAEL